MKGKLIVIEGCDGAGKETQTKLLKEALLAKGVKVATLDFPRYKDTVGGKIAAYCLGKDKDHLPDFQFAKLDPYTASLPYVMDRYESKSFLQDLLEKNDYVILDRYFTSNILLQGAKMSNLAERERYINFDITLELELLGIPKPDLVFYLWIPVEKAFERLEKREREGVQVKDMHESDEEFVRNSNGRGKEIAQFCAWQVVDGVEGDRELSREEVHQKVLTALGF